MDRGTGGDVFREDRSRPSPNADLYGRWAMVDFVERTNPNEQLSHPDKGSQDTEAVEPISSRCDRSDAGEASEKKRSQRRDILMLDATQEAG